MEPRYAIVMLAAYCGFGTQATVGFGGLLISLTLAVHVYPVARVLAWLVPVSLLVTGPIAFQNRRDIDRPLIVRRVLPLMVVGAACGLALVHRIGGPWLRHLFGALVVLLAASALHRLVFRRNHQSSVAERGASKSKASASWAVFGAGLVHGIYACGGPLLVYGMSRSGLNKARFRATLCAVFFTMNSALVLTYLALGRLGAAQLPGLLWLVPVVLLARLSGQWLHERVDEHRFQVLVYGLLLFAGGSLVWR